MKRRLGLVHTGRAGARKVLCAKNGITVANWSVQTALPATSNDLWVFGLNEQMR